MDDGQCKAAMGRSPLASGAVPPVRDPGMPAHMPRFDDIGVGGRPYGPASFERRQRQRDQSRRHDTDKHERGGEHDSENSADDDGGNCREAPDEPRHAAQRGTSGSPATESWPFHGAPFIPAVAVGL